MIRKFRPYLLILALAATAFCTVCAIRDASAPIRQPQLSLGLRTLFNAVTFALYCIVLVLSVIGGRSKFIPSARKGLKILIWMLLLYICCSLVTRTVATSYPITVSSATASVVAAVFLWRYFVRRKQSSDSVSSNSIRRSASGSGRTKYAWAMLHGALMVSVIMSVLYFFLTLKSADNYFILAPLAAILLCLILWRIIRWRGWLLAAAVALAFEAVVFICGTFSAYGFGSFATVVAFSLLYISLLVPLCDLYCSKEQNI